MGKKENPVNIELEESTSQDDEVGEETSNLDATVDGESPAVGAEPEPLEITAAATPRAEPIATPSAEPVATSSEQTSEQREIELALALAEAQDQIQTLWRDKSNIHDQLLRRQAEFENFRKRQEKERVEYLQRARAELVLELLPVLDNFERALSSIDKSEGEPGSLRQGVELIHKQLRDALTKLGLQPVESVGVVFDPNVHEAVTSEPSEEHEENTIIEEFQRGYKLGERLLRPAKVKVASAPEK